MVDGQRIFTGKLLTGSFFLAFMAISSTRCRQPLPWNIGDDGTSTSSVVSNKQQVYRRREYSDKFTLNKTLIIHQTDDDGWHNNFFIMLSSPFCF